MKNVLIIGGTRNMGYYLTLQLLEEGHRVTILNRGISPDDLPAAVHRLRADRTYPQQLRRALLAKHFDAAVDFVLHREEEASTIADLLRDQVGHFIAISSGQVYLVREGHDVQRPFTEAMYAAGRPLPAPQVASFAREEWDYGVNKRAVEDALFQAWQTHHFPVTTLRLPMVYSERDPFRRLYNYILRLGDGGPILTPETPNYPLRHVYGGDVVRAIIHLIETGAGQGRAFNIAQDETIALDDFISLLGRIMNVEPRIVRFKRSELVANGFLPDCSPFSERWMSELDNTRSKDELGLRYTPLADVLERLVAHYRTKRPPTPPSYKRRPAEIQMAKGND